jgi:hypothetical protein
MLKTVIFDYDADNFGLKCDIQQVEFVVSTMSLVSPEKFDDVDLQFLQIFVKIGVR